MPCILEVVGTSLSIHYLSIDLSIYLSGSIVPSSVCAPRVESPSDLIIDTIFLNHGA